MQKQPKLTFDLLGCGHCNCQVVMQPIVEQDMYDANEGIGTEWYILRCSRCNEINVIQRSYESEPVDDYLEWFYNPPQYLYPYLDKPPQEGMYKDTIANDLREQLEAIRSPQTANFLAEAISCFEQQLFRSCVILAWTGAVSLLQDRVFEQHLSLFNIEAARRNPKWKPAKSKDDLNNLKEYEFIEIIENLSMIGKNTKQQLQNILQLRNACGHPSALRVDRRGVAYVLEILTLNVYHPFAL